MRRCHNDQLAGGERLVHETLQNIGVTMDEQEFNRFGGDHRQHPEFHVIPDPG
jgi:hypothetical protein